MASISAESVTEVSRRWEQSPVGQREDIIARAAGDWGCSARTVRRRIQGALGRSRRVRRDAGARPVDDQVLARGAELLARTTTKKGHITGTLGGVLELLEREGLVEPGAVTASTLGRWLRAVRLSPRHLRAVSAAITRIAEHPNHVHLVDASVCLTWYLRQDGRIVRQSHLERTLYKNKPHEWAKLRQILWRYVLVDHCSGAFYVRYYYAPGENAQDLLDFLHRAWSPKPDPLQAPFHGVPRVLAADQGPGLKAQATRNLLATLDVALDLHLPGVARASGGVESLHWAWERWFESRLLLSPASDLEQLNELAYLHAMQISASQRHRHSRHGMPRRDAWVAWMRDEYLRLCPDRELFMHLAHRDEETRVMDGRGRISVALPGVGQTWFELRGTVHVGEVVRVRIHPYQERMVHAWNSDDDELEVIRLEENEHGYLVGGRVGGWAGEDYDRHREQEVDRIRRAAAEEATIPHEVAFGDPRTTVRPIPMIGAPLHGRPALAGRAAPEITYSRFDAKTRIRESLGRPISRSESDWIDGQFTGPLVTAGELDRILDELPAAAATTA